MNEFVINGDLSLIENYEQNIDTCHKITAILYNNNDEKYRDVENNYARLYRFYILISILFTKTKNKKIFKKIKDICKKMKTTSNLKQVGRYFVEIISYIENIKRRHIYLSNTERFDKITSRVLFLQSELKHILNNN